MRPFLNVDDSGGTGRPVLFQHGLCGDARQTAEVFPADPAFHRFTLEMRGHGKSEAGDPQDFSIATFAADLVDLVEDRKLAPLAIGGISMGAAIALRLAVKKPHIVKALIVARPAWLVEAAPPNMQPNAEVGELLTRLPPEKARLAFDNSATAKRLAQDGPDNLTSLHGFFSREPIVVTSALLKSISGDGPGITADDLRRIGVPTLVIGHDLDVIHPLAMAEELAALIPTARLVRIAPKADDKPRYVAEFRAALHDFLKENA